MHSDCRKLRGKIVDLKDDTNFYYIKVDWDNGKSEWYNDRALELEMAEPRSTNRKAWEKQKLFNS